MNGLQGALEYLLDNIEYPPERNCSCHLSPPCNDCIDYGALRNAIEEAKAAILVESRTPALAATWPSHFARIDHEPYYSRSQVEVMLASVMNNSKLLSELLAVLHRDGGQYLAEHGTEKATEIAIQNYYGIVEAMDANDEDATRYRWLKNNPIAAAQSPRVWDAAIDAALQTAGRGEG